MSTAVEQSLQIALQEPAAAIGVAVLLGGGLVGMSIRTIVESVVIDDETDVSEEGSDREHGRDSSVENTDRETTTRSVENEATGTEADPEQLEHRLDELETEVGSLSATVDSVRAENEQISSSVEEVEENTGRLVSLFRRATGGGTTASPDKPATDTDESAQPGQTQTAKTDDGSQQARETELIDESQIGGSDETDSGQSSPGVREKHCVDSDEEIIDTPGTTETVSKTDDKGITEEVEEIGAGTFEGTRFNTPETTSETFGVEETISTPAMASDGGTAVASEGTVETATNIESEQTSVEPEIPATPETEPATEPEPVSEPAPEPATPRVQETEPKLETLTTGPKPDAKSEGKPYLNSVPDGFGAELLTVEWLEFLVAEVGIREAARAIDYYETIGWLTEDAAAELDEYLDGVEPGAQADLSVEHHLRTLEYVEELRISDTADNSEDSR